MCRFLVILFVLSGFHLTAQTSDKYNSQYADYYRAEDLFEKQQYGAARKVFRQFIDNNKAENDPFHVKARYYEGVSALELFNNDAITILEQFNTDYPESIYKTDIYYRIGKFYYNKKKYKDALEWFDQLAISDVEEPYQEQFWFMIGYANFHGDNFDKAKSAFHEIKDGDSDYASAALYYYSHIAYQDGNYQEALEGFQRLENHEKFGKVVPYYIAQILYLQGNYEAVTAYADKLRSDGTTVRESDINHLIGDAYYRTGQYEKAIPFLQKYNSSSKTTRDEDYQLGFAYYKVNNWVQAIRMFDRVKGEEDSLSQAAYYHMAECFLKLDNKVSARSAFEGAAYIDADEKIQEDALFNFAILSYQLDINPYDEAVEAFELYLNKYPNSERKEDVFQYLVNVYLSTNNYEKALLSIDKIQNKDVKLKTAYQIVAFNQGIKRFQDGNFNGSIESFGKVKKYPVNTEVSAKAVYWTAEANYRSRQYDKAIAGYKEFLNQPSTVLPTLRAEAYYNTGYAYLEKEKGLSENQQMASDIWTKAIEAFRLFIQSNPTNKRKKVDAYMRIGDQYFRHGSTEESADDQAIKYYGLAYDEHAGFEDQALFYMAITYGLNENTSKKISKLKKVLDDYPSSRYFMKSLFELAQTYNAIDDYSNAIKYYNKIIFDYPTSDKVVISKLSIADIYYRQGNPQKAEAEYRAILEQHGNNSEVCELVAGSLRSMFEAEGQPEKIEQMISEYPCANISSNELEFIYYNPAYNAYHDSTLAPVTRYTKAIPLIEQYLTKFPNGQNKILMLYYLGDSYWGIDEKEKAIAAYRNAIDNGGTMDFTKNAVARVAQYLYDQEKFKEAIPYFNKLSQISFEPDHIYGAQLGLMRSYYTIEEWQRAALHAGKLIALDHISGDHRLEGHYKQGMSYFKLERYNECFAPLEYVVDNTTKWEGFEAKFTIAEAYFLKNNLDVSEQEITELLKMKPQKNYWIAKGIMLRSKIHVARGDLTSAEMDLKSVIEHYAVQDDGIIEEANALWDELMQLKEVNKDIEEGGNGEIDINDGGNEE